ncbi:hypothetical protein B6N60_00567 [Richelia sinica FACHB-800]|uniref:Uncharacterized protein n=1 Tax=Richelia sinica FACHB-800 TaxID=1357546 RepID=A0A975T4D6_9NOST|nr:hypothetical protein B6N60_00567 [Richelia sinica FACHB-800]
MHQRGLGGFPHERLAYLSPAIHPGCVGRAIAQRFIPQFSQLRQ